MLDYRADFLLGVSCGGIAAEIQIQHSRKRATVYLCEFHNEQKEFYPKKHAKHEAVHLFLSRLSSLANTRFLLEREIDDAEEGMVRVLERVLK